jgi:type I restriction enzyme R subunit
MVFLVRKMRADALLRRFKVIVVTDRKDLQRQLSDTATLTGENVDVAESTAGVKALARARARADLCHDPEIPRPGKRR